MSSHAWYLRLATPGIHLLTSYLVPFAAWQRALLTATTLGYRFVLAPLQYALPSAALEGEDEAGGYEHHDE